MQIFQAEPSTVQVATAALLLDELLELLREDELELILEDELELMPDDELLDRLLDEVLLVVAVELDVVAARLDEGELLPPPPPPPQAESRERTLRPSSQESNGLGICMVSPEFMIIAWIFMLLCKVINRIYVIGYLSGQYSLGMA